MIEIVEIYQGEDVCTQCLGWKRVSEESGESWKYWAELPSPANIAVQMGIVKPVVCPRCQGTGIEPKLIAEIEKPETCEWKDDGEGNYTTACGKMFTLIVDTPEENEMVYCPFCGKRIKTVEGEVIDDFDPYEGGWVDPALEAELKAEEEATLSEPEHDEEDDWEDEE